MSDVTVCPRCVIKGAVRMEHVIQAGHSYRSLECLNCGHEWRVLETGEHVPKSDSVAPEDKPDRSRPTVTPIDARKTPRS